MKDLCGDFIFGSLYLPPYLGVFIHQQVHMFPAVADNGESVVCIRHRKFRKATDRVAYKNVEVADIFTKTMHSCQVAI